MLRRPFSTAHRYTKDHELVKFDDDTRIGTISITNYAQSSLGDVVFVELPAEGSKVTQGGMFSLLFSTSFDNLSFIFVH